MSFNPRAKLTIPALKKWARSRIDCIPIPANDPVYRFTQFSGISTIIPGAGTFPNAKTPPVSANGTNSPVSPMQTHISWERFVLSFTVFAVLYTIVDNNSAINGLAINGRKNLLPRTEKLTSIPTAMIPLPTRAPVRLCVVEIGIPRIAASKTVVPAPNATAALKSGEEATKSGTNPLPVKLLTRVFARKMELTEPSSVVIVARRIA